MRHKTDHTTVDVRIRGGHGEKTLAATDHDPFYGTSEGGPWVNVREGRFDQRTADQAMTGRSFVVELPASFVVSRAFPTAVELAYGYSEGLLDASATVALAVAKLEAGLVLAPAELSVALLLSDEFDRLDDLVRDLQVGSEPLERRARFWLLMVLTWVFERRGEFDDPLGVVELVYSDFDHPEEIEGLVRFMPMQPGQEAGVDALMRHWEAFVSEVGIEYRERNESLLR